MKSQASLGARSRGAASGLSSRLHIGFYALYIGWSMDAGTVLLVPQGEHGGEAVRSALGTGAWIVLYATSFVLLLFIRRHNVTNLVIIVSFGTLLLTSALWSVDPGHSAVQALVMVANLTVAYMIACDLTLPQIARLIGLVAFSMIAISLVLYYVGVDAVYYIDVHQRPNLFGGDPARGLFGHKIKAGLYAVVAAVYAVGHLRGWRRVVSTLVIVWFVILTSSATALILLPASILILVAVRGSAKNAFSTPLFLVTFGAISIAATFVLLASWNTLMDSLGRSATLTGRTVLWEWGLNAWLGRPILGWGYGEVYFSSDHASRVKQTIPSMQSYDVPHFHNSFIQTGVDLGVVGLGLTTAAIIYVMLSAYKYSLECDVESGALVLSLSTVFCIAAVTMHLFVNTNHFVTMFFGITYFSLRQWSSRKLLARRP